MSPQRQQKQRQLLGRLQDLLLGPKADEQTTCEVLDYFLRRLGSSQVASRVLAMKVSPQPACLLPWASGHLQRVRGLLWRARRPPQQPARLLCFGGPAPGGRPAGGLGPADGPVCSQGLSLVLSEGGLRDGEERGAPAEEDSGDAEALQGYQWLLRDLPRLPLFPGVSAPAALALQQAVHVETDPQTVSAYLVYLSRHAPVGEQGQHSDLALVRGGAFPPEQTWGWESQGEPGAAWCQVGRPGPWGVGCAPAPPPPPHGPPAGEAAGLRHAPWFSSPALVWAAASCPALPGGLSRGLAVVQRLRAAPVGSGADEGPGGAPCPCP